jgi:hypothetical protein
LGLATFGDSTAAAGVADGNVVSLGDGGSAVYTFSPPLSNGPGADVAIFENGLSDNFLELAFVEISSDGVNFYRFPASSLTDTTMQIGAFGALEPTQLNNLAGKYRVNFGTPFDFDVLQGQANLNLRAVSHLKIIDVVGSLTDSLLRRDKDGRPINDPFPTPFASGGFDLDAIALLSSNNVGVSEAAFSKDGFLFPNPAKELLFTKKPFSKCQVFNTQGQKCPVNFVPGQKKLSLKELKPGLYWFTFTLADGTKGRQKIQVLP